METLKVLDYSNVFLASYFTDDRHCSHWNREHTSATKGVAQEKLIIALHRLHLFKSPISSKEVMKEGGISPSLPFTLPYV